MSKGTRTRVRTRARARTRNGRGRSTRPNVDVLASMFGQMKTGERKVVNKSMSDEDKLNQLFSNLTPFNKKLKRSGSISKGTKASRRKARESRKSSKMDT